MIRYSQNRCPHRFKWQLVDWAMKKFDVSESKANSYSKIQLIAIWHRCKGKTVI